MDKACFPHDLIFFHELISNFIDPIFCWFSMELEPFSSGSSNFGAPPDQIMAIKGILWASIVCYFPLDSGLRVVSNLFPCFSLFSLLFPPFNPTCSCSAIKAANPFSFLFPPLASPFFPWMLWLNLFHEKMTGIPAYFWGKMWWKPNFLPFHIQSVKPRVDEMPSCVAAFDAYSWRPWRQIDSFSGDDEVK